MNSRIASHPRKDKAALAPLLTLSASLGRDPLLAQASNGNTSIKVDGTLWIKASGKWLADAARDEILVSVDLEEAASCLRRGDSIACTGEWGADLRPSIETAMHAVLPHRVVVHVHSVNAIAWAIREDAPAQLAGKLAGLRWAWVPYVASGAPLAQAVEMALFGAPEADILVLGNHGLVVCGDSCEAVAQRLREVEQRLQIPRRAAPAPDFDALAEAACTSEWTLPENAEMHALGSDSVSRRIIEGGVLYPCQAVFLGPEIAVAPSKCDETGAPFLLVEGAGVLLNPGITGVERAMLAGLVEVVQRTEPAAPIRYLTMEETLSLLDADVYRQREPVPEEAALRS